MFPETTSAQDRGKLMEVVRSRKLMQEIWKQRDKGF